MPTPILAPNHTWFSQGGTTVKRASITQIDIKDIYTPTGTVTSSWDASAAKDGSVMAYVEGTKLTIAGNGSGKVYANADSSYVFSCDTSDVFSNLVTITGADIFDTGSATTFNRIFCKAKKLKTVNVGNWNTDNVTDMGYVFSECPALEEAAVSNWNTENVTYMRSMFQVAIKLTALDLSAWDVGKVTDMSQMFLGHTSYGDMAITSLGDVSKWDTHSLTNMQAMFQRCTSLKTLDLSGWDTSSVTNMSYAFYWCTNLTTVGDTSDWDVRSVTTMHNLFYNCSALQTLDVSNWDVGSVTSMEYTFYHCFSLQALDVSNWNTENVTNMGHMFSGDNYGATKWHLKELDVSKWDTSSCTDFSFMFYGLNGVDGRLTLDVSNWDVSKGETFDHLTAHSYITLNGIENWYTPAATNMYAMFYSIQNPVIDVSNLVTDNVYVFGQMFEACTNTEEIIGLTRFNTANGVSFDEMFLNCTKLKKLDLSSFDTRKAKDGVTVSTNGGKSACMASMLGNMHRLEEIRLGENFSFDGDGTTTNASHRLAFPAPNSSYISGADGNWYTIDKEAIAPSAITEGAGTYFATPAAADTADHEPMLVAHGSLLRTAQSLRKIGGSANGYYPSEFHGVVDEANEEVAEQSELLTLLENVLAEKAAGGGGGIDLDSFKSAWVTGGVFRTTPSHIVFTDGMTWAEFVESPWNGGSYDDVGPVINIKPFLKVLDGRVCVAFGFTPPNYLVRNDSESWDWYSNEPKDDDIVVSPSDPIMNGAYYWTRSTTDWNP